MTFARSQAKKRHPKTIVLAFLRDEAAASAVLFALTLASTVGFVGLGVETGLWFAERRGYQTAADAGAYAGALEVGRQLTSGVGSPTLDTTSTGIAWKETVRNGATNSADNIGIFLLSPTTTPSRPTYTVRVEVTQPKDSLFAEVLSLTSVTITTAAEAQISSIGKGCITAIGTSGTVINIQGSATINAPNCVIAANSSATGTSTANGGSNQASVTLQGGSNTNVDVAQIYSSGSVVQGGTPDVEAPLAGMGSTSPNPFSSAPTPSSVPTPCVAATAGSTIVGPKTLCKTGSTTQTGAVSLSGGNFTFSGTIYIENGDFSIGSGANVTGTNTTFVLTGSPNSKIGSFSVGSNSTVNVTAPDINSSSPYKGIAFYQNPNAPASNNGNGTHVNSFGGGGTTTITGAVYAPAETVNWGGNAATACTIIVAKVINFTGNSSLDTSNCDNFVNLPTYYSVALTE